LDSFVDGTSVGRIISLPGPIARRPTARPNASSSPLCEWAYGHAYANSDQRREALPLWNHFCN